MNFAEAPGSPWQMMNQLVLQWEHAQTGWARVEEDMDPQVAFPAPVSSPQALSPSPVWPPVSLSPACMVLSISV